MSASQSIPPDRLPDPWLFDSEKLLRELDRIREMILLIPTPTHEVYFAVNNAVTYLQPDADLFPGHSSDATPPQPAVVG